jgi:hypothetical protein
MSISPVSGSSSVAASATLPTKPKPASQSAPPAQPSKSQATAAVVSTIAATLQEATETGAQTTKEAASGDHQAQRVLQHQAAAAPHGSTIGSVINTKA